LIVTTVGTDEIVTWAEPNTGTAQLQRANSVTGPWSDVIGATSPHTNAIANAPKFYRTLWVPPAL
jgi:hypothetical protein